MKRWIAILCIFVLLFSLAGCRSSYNEEEEAVADVEYNEKPSEQQPSDDQQDQPQDQKEPEQQKPAENTDNNTQQTPQPEQKPQEQETPETQQPSGDQQTPAQPERSEEPEADEEEPVEPNLTLMTFNVRNNDDENHHTRAERMPRVQKIINEYSPDVVGLMELKPAWVEHFTNSYPEYGFFSHYRETVLTPTSEALGILYKKDTVELLEEDFFWLSETPDKESKGWDAKYLRICVWAKLKHKATGKTFIYIDLHLDGTDACQNGSFRLVEALIAKNEEYPCFVGGDFNTLVGSVGHNLYTGILEEARLEVQNTTSVPDTLTVPLGYPQIKDYNHSDSNHLIDFLFHQEDRAKSVDYIVHDKTVDGYYASDHYAVICKYKI